MRSALSSLWCEPFVNPVNHKAHSIPFLNPINKYGRVFFFSWFGFLIAFWSWYAFPPLLGDVIAKDLGLSAAQVSNSNIIALTATLLVRLVAGPACDRYGPRLTFAACLLIGAVPTFLAGTASSAAGLYTIRFFVGILGGSFVPCQVWTTAFFDKNIVGTANALTAGLGNAGGGITYFVMPAIFKALVADGMTAHQAWRVTFVVPGCAIVAVAVALVLLCPDLPTGKWSNRLRPVGHTEESQYQDNGQSEKFPSKSTSGTLTPAMSMREKKPIHGGETPSEHEVQCGETLDLVQREAIRDPSFKGMVAVLTSPQTLVLGATYFSSFGAELAINSILGRYYSKNIPSLDLQTSGNWAAMFGLMNVIFRPLGGAVSDVAYKYTQSLWAKKALLHAYNIIMGVFLLAIGISDPYDLHTLALLVGVGMAFFLEGANGLTYSLLPHVHPQANGVVSGFAGACGNLGGIVFAIVFRYHGSNYAQSIYIIGAICIGLNLAVIWIRPVPMEKKASS